MNEKEKELYDKKKWKHTNPIETLRKALKDINFGKNAVLLSIGANDFETEKAVSESFENNELIIATDVREKDADIVVNNHLLVLKESIGAENFTIDDFNKFFGNDNYKYKYGKPYVIYDRLSALWYSLYKGKIHITKKILDNYIGLLDDNGYLITDFYENSDFINAIQSIYDYCICKKYQKSTYELFKYYVDIDLYIDKKIDIDRDKMNHLMVISRSSLVSLSNVIGRVNKICNPVIEEHFVGLKYSFIIYFIASLIIELFIINSFNGGNTTRLIIGVKIFVIIHFIITILFLSAIFKDMYKKLMGI